MGYRPCAGFAIVLLLLAQVASAGILFEESFDSLSDWESAQEESKACGDGSDIVLYSGTCTTTCPPETSYSDWGNWTIGYYASSVFCDSPGNQMYRINNTDPRGGSGKSLQHWIENGATPTWTGGRLIMELPVPQETLYFRFYVKFPSTFRWSDGTDHAYHKMLSISSFPVIDDLANGGSTTRGSAGWHSPDFIWQNFTNISMHSYDETTVNPEPRAAPGYDTTVLPNTNAVYDWTVDGQWHHVEVKLSLNSAPGVADGEYTIWWDGVQRDSVTTYTWVKSVAWQSGYAYDASLSTHSITPLASNRGFRPVSSHTSGGTEPNWASATTFGDIVTDGNGNQWEYFTDFKWNVIWLLDNIHIGSTGAAEQDIYVDDLVVSTEYVGPSYVIGDGTPAQHHGGGMFTISGGTIQ